MRTLHNTEFNYLLLAGLAKVVMWLAFVVLHLALAVIGLFLLWWWQVPPSHLAEFLASIPDDKPVQWLGVMGGSALTILALDCWCWRKIYTGITTPYIFRDAKRAAGL